MLLKIKLIFELFPYMFQMQKLISFEVDVLLIVSQI